MLMVVVSGVILATLMALCCAMGWCKYLLSCAVLVRGDAESKRNPIFWFTSAREFCSLRWVLTLFMALMAGAAWVFMYLSGLLWHYDLPLLIISAVGFVGIVAILAYLGVSNGAAMHLCFWQHKLPRAELNDGVYVMIYRDQNEDALTTQRRLVWGWQYRYWRETPIFEGTLGQLIDELYHLQEQRAELEGLQSKMAEQQLALATQQAKLEARQLNLEAHQMDMEKHWQEARILNAQQSLELMRKEIDFDAKVVKSIYALFDSMTAKTAA